MNYKILDMDFNLTMCLCDVCDTLGYKIFELWDIKCHNPSLGLTTKIRVCKNAGQEKDSGVWEGVRMNTHTPK
jgi:hypothetical protein